MSADATVVQQMVTGILNVSAPGSLSTTVESTNYDRNADAIAESVREGAMMIAQAIVSNPKHVHRNLFMSPTATALTHGAELPDMAGPLDIVEIKRHSAGDFRPGQLRDVQEIDSIRNDTLYIYDGVSHTNAHSRNSGFYATANGRFYFTGYSAQAYFPVISRTTVTTLIPDEYEPTWVKLSVGLSIKEGDNLESIAQFYMNLGLADLGAIASMGVVQSLPTAEQARKARGNP